MTEEQEKNIVEAIKLTFPEDFVSAEKQYDFISITIKKEKIRDLLSFLYTHELKFQFLTDLCGVHYPDKKGSELAVVYHLHSLTNNLRLRIKVFTSIENAMVDSVTNVYNAANWMERETYDFFGITFIGHPDLKRILNVDDMLIFPMRKEFPLEDQTRMDKDNAMFGR
jgi:NADH-quinone oxidoreductase subunit C